MKKEQTNSLLNKYYKGDSTQNEEAVLKGQILEDNLDSPELDAFGYYAEEGSIPADLEEDIFNTIRNKEKQRKRITRSLFSITSIAASIVIVLSVYLDSRNKKYQELENSFFVMEQAMYQVSETIHPQEQEEMLVLWVDDEMEIIIN
ncbi:MAG: hypothetical protein HQ541_23910 [Mariniphaga sp.]|nr:hypothetical protein [Mariniphaga sp.]